MTRKVLFFLVGIIAVILILIISFLFYFGKNFGSNHRRNYFVEGEFVGFNESNDEEFFSLTVTSTSKEEFQKADGINVVHDKYTNTYFSLTMYYQVNNNEEKYYLTFKNLTAYGTPIMYKDDLGNYITPNNRDNQSNAAAEPDYSININYKNDRENMAYVYLAKK